jgi:hypothetical protein
MPDDIIDLADFKVVLGVGDLYADEDLERVTQAATNILLAYLIQDEDDPIDYALVPEVVEAATAIAVDMWQSRLAPGGTINAIDFTPGPYRMGKSLITRVSGLIGQHMDTGSFVG